MDLMFILEDLYLKEMRITVNSTEEHFKFLFLSFRSRILSEKDITLAVEGDVSLWE